MNYKTLLMLLVCLFALEKGDIFLFNDLQIIFLKKSLSPPLTGYNTCFLLELNWSHDLVHHGCV